ncbi:MAG: O-antigen ligase family protein, partial [Solirubrobacterales bacterium]
SAGAPRLSGPRMTRAVGAVTIGAAAVIIVGAVARSALIGVVIGGIYMLVAEPRFRRRALPIVAAALALALGSLLTPAGDLWTSRLSADAVQSFDRPATWLSGIRIALDDPLTGVGEREIIRDIDDVRRYRQTPLGDTGVLPHNSWILTFAEGGIAALVVLVALTALLVGAIRPPPGGRSTEERFYVAALLGIAAIALVNNVFRHPELMVPVLMMVSILAARGERGRCEHGEIRGGTRDESYRPTPTSIEVGIPATATIGAPPR